MKTKILTLILLSTSLSLADETGTLIFEDNFNRTESQKLTDEIGNGWNTNSKTRAKGNKQTDLKDGALHIYIHKAADHAVSVTHDAEFTNGTVKLRFKLDSKDDSLGLNFADLKLKEVHAGHLFAARIHTHRILLQDLKTGAMANAIYDLRKAKKELTPEQKKTLKTKEKSFPNELETGKWHHLTVDINADTLSVKIDDQEIATLQSKGIAHPTKRTLRLAVPKNATVDDLKIWKK